MNRVWTCHKIFIFLPNIWMAEAILWSRDLLDMMIVIFLLEYKPILSDFWESISFMFQISTIINWICLATRWAIFAQSELNTQRGNSMLAILTEILVEPDLKLSTEVAEDLCKMLMIGAIVSLNCLSCACSLSGGVCAGAKTSSGTIIWLSQTPDWGTSWGPSSPSTAPVQASPAFDGAAFIPTIKFLFMFLDIFCFRFCSLLLGWDRHAGRWHVVPPPADGGHVAVLLPEHKRHQHFGEHHHRARQPWHDSL